MEQGKHTAENGANVETYLPLAMKSALAKVLAPGCIEKVEGPLGRWQERIIGRALVEVYVLVGFYCHKIDTSGLDEAEPRFEFTLEQYDKWARLEDELAAKGDERCSELLADFRRFQDILNREIQNQLEEKNDPLLRMSEALAAGLTPEIMRALRTAAGDVQGGEEA